MFVDGHPFPHFERSADGSIKNLTMDVLDKDGKSKVTMVDKDADGQWDFKIDNISKKMFVWKEARWVDPSKP